MKVTNLTEGSKIYTSNVYLILGDFNGIDDVNTIIDSGRDSSIFNKITMINTGLGKKQVDQIIITHCHFDHNALAPELKKICNAKILAYSKEQESVDILLKEGMFLKAGDRQLEVIYTPGHSFDSISLWEPKQGILFTGDMNLELSNNCKYEDFVVESFHKLIRLDITLVYPGHGPPIDGERVKKMVRESLNNNI
ncbi:MAG: MBL fold metallo-hydrolase [Euryarchaeota archaeon]|nr:MBL fold metallo-hydrolase [Euryarchaeota archaeon]